MSAPTWEAWNAAANTALANAAAQRAAARAASPPPDNAFAEHIKRIVDAAPPLTPEHAARLRSLLVPLNPRPAEEPRQPRLGKRSVNPEPGTLYARHLRASDGACNRCHAPGRREVDHCHEHDVVRGLICRSCNATPEVSMDDDYRSRCSWCVWDAWLRRELELLGPS